MIDHNNIDSSLFSFSSFILSWYVYKKEKCFEILSCIMEMYRVFIKTQRKIEVRKTNSIDGFFAKRWSANTPAQLTAFKQCPCWLRFCKKSYGILLFRTSIFLYVFMNTWRHSRIKLSIVCWTLSFFKFFSNRQMFIINAHTVKHTHCVVVWIT